MITALSSFLLGIKCKNRDIAFHNGKLIDYIHFQEDVVKQVHQFTQQKQTNIAVYYEQAYPFAVSFFAALHSHKKIWIAANNTKKTADKLQQQDCLLVGEWQGSEFTFLESNLSDKVKLEALNDEEQQIIIFTSGSSGQAKKISKSLKQFQAEIETLENYWGKRLANAQILATVSHQHIYGLLFRVLWPLAAGRCFHSELFLSPEPLLNYVKIKPTCWVASPAQLKRLDELTPWQEISHLTTIFSSGGDLPLDIAKQIHQQSRQKIIEIFGSSETGGIAWRQSIDDKNWTLFNKLKLSINEQKKMLLTSPYLSSAKYTLDDQINIISETQFSLLGRVDRLVKIEEKRLSLNELELSLNDCQWVEHSHVFIIHAKRDKVAAVIVLSKLAEELIETLGKSKLVKQIRLPLLNQFENVVLPRQWLFINSLPLTTQGKINQPLLTELLSLDSNRFPQIVRCDFQCITLQLELKIPAKLIYFKGHFPEQAILPGVTQLAWVEFFGKLFFEIKQPFSRMEVIKFKKIISPADTVIMTLNWKDATGKLYFEIKSKTDSHSSGRLVYGDIG